MKSKVSIKATQLIEMYQEGYTVSEMTTIINNDLQEKYPEDTDYRVTDAKVREYFAVLNQRTNNKYDLRKKPQRNLVDIDFDDLLGSDEDQALNEYDHRKEELDPRNHDDF